MCVKPASCEARQTVSGQQDSGMITASTEAVHHNAMYLQFWHLELDLIIPVLLVAAGPAKACSKVSLFNCHSGSDLRFKLELTLALNQYRTIYRCSFDWLLNCLYAWPGWSWQGCGNCRSVATAAAPQSSTKRSTDALFVEQFGTLYLWWLGSCTGWKKRPTRLNPDSSFTQVQPRQRFRHLSLQSCPHNRNPELA